MYFLHARTRRKKYSSKDNNGENSTYYFDKTTKENFTLPTYIVSSTAYDEDDPARRTSRFPKK